MNCRISSFSYLLNNDRCNLNKSNSSLLVCSRGSFSKVNGLWKMPLPIMMPSIPYFSASSSPVFLSGISSLIVNNVFGAISSRKFLIASINSQCASTLLMRLIKT
uniref:Uncharacterized protein n=1 Tax=Staphylococcus aureus TaxID=1280 RepID=Q9LC05_STAAU|nr:hypothetical protein [Staphylococcus aureus]